MPPTAPCPVQEANETDEMVTTERVAVVVHLLTLGRKMTTAQVAARVGVNRHAAWYMLSKISRVLPLTQIDGLWVMYMDGADW